MTHLTYAEAIVVGLIQGVTELFPISSLGHNVLLPALIGGSWATDLNVSTSKSYLAFIVGLHVATAIALMIYFWRDWIRIIGGFVSSVRDRQVATVDQKMAWMIILATIPVGLAGLLFDHAFRVLFGKPVLAAIFLIVNGLILFAGERMRTRASLKADEQLAAQRQEEIQLQTAGAGPRGRSAHASGQRAVRQQEATQAEQADTRLTGMGFPEAVIIGAAQILALLAGISRDGVTMVAGMFRGLSREDAARFAFLLATPVILAAGVLKMGDLLGPDGNGIRGQILVGSLLSGIGAYLSVRWLVRYFQTRTLTPFAVYCVLFGAASAIYLAA
ncbi:MAG TPA: undecaprenyl-diphosphate phosphatase [Streptosporangiaceae bacterium]|jgi:undecaprenyl-diphosphatase